MRRCPRTVVWPAGASVLLLVVTLVASSLQAGSAGASPMLPTDPRAADPGRQLWVSRYDGGDQDYLRAIGVSPDGSRVYVSGGSAGQGTADDYATAAYDSSTGTQLWTARYDGHGGEDDVAGLAVGPGGATMFVTGESSSAHGDPGFATVAYDGASGARLWVAGFNGPPGLNDAPAAIAASPDGSKVFVTGLSYLDQFHVDFATVAYDAQTGKRLWVRFYDFGSVEIANQPAAIAVSPDGSMVFVTGESYVQAKDSYDYATVAYDALTGQAAWVARYDGPAGSDDTPRAIAVSPGGSTVFVTGESIGTGGGYDYATVAYDAATGAERWAGRWDGPTHGEDLASSIGVDPGGGAVYVTGSTTGTFGYDYGTVAYDTSTGAQLWGTRFAGPAGGGDSAYALAVSPGGSRVYVTGETDNGPTGGYNYGTIAYEASTGRQLWIRRYDGPGRDNDIGLAIATTPGGSKVFVAGESIGSTFDYDFATVAYSTI